MLYICRWSTSTTDVLQTKHARPAAFKAELGNPFGRIVLCKLTISPPSLFLMQPSSALVHILGSFDNHIA